MQLTDGEQHHKQVVLIKTMTQDSTAEPQAPDIHTHLLTSHTHTHTHTHIHIHIHIHRDRHSQGERGTCVHAEAAADPDTSRYSETRRHGTPCKPIPSDPALSLFQPEGFLHPTPPQSLRPSISHRQ